MSSAQMNRVQLPLKMQKEQHGLDKDQLTHHFRWYVWTNIPDFVDHCQDDYYCAGDGCGKADSCEGEQDEGKIVSWLSFAKAPSQQSRSSQSEIQRREA